MDIIRVHKFDEVYVRVDCDESIAMELTEYFSFFVPGYRFMPLFRSKQWDGKVRLFNRRNHMIYAGLVPYIQEFAKTREAEVVFENDPVYGSADDLQTIDPADLAEFITNLALHAHGEKIEPRPHQLVAISHALKHKRMMLLSPTASGKSLIIYAVIRWFLDHPIPGRPEKVLLIVPTTSLCSQMQSDFADYSAKDKNWNAKDHIGVIMEGRSKNPTVTKYRIILADKSIKEFYQNDEVVTKRGVVLVQDLLSSDELLSMKIEKIEKIVTEPEITITTWQSIFRLPPLWFKPYGMVIGDEAHTFKAKCLTSIMEKLHDASYRIGTTGTLDGTVTHKLVLEGLFGPVYQVTTTRELIDLDHLADFTIDIALLKYPEEICKACKSLSYADELDMIVRYSHRNRFIRNLALAQNGNTLVLYNFVEKHGKPLHAMIVEKLNGTNRKVFFVSGGVEAEIREQIRAIVEKESDAIIVASLGTFSTGINIRNLHNIIFASPSKSQIRILQSIGRGLRKSDNGKATKIYDIADDLHYKKHRNYTLEHAGERVKLYAKEQFKYTITEVVLQ